MRIGLRQIKNIATALAMEQLFVSKNDIVKGYMSRIWVDTIDIVASSMSVLQIHTNQTKNRALNLDSMMLAALIHNIGVLPILTEAERHADVFANPTFLDVALEKLASEIGTSIMIEWGFEPEFVDITQNCKDLSVTSDTVSYLDLVRVASALCGKFNNHEEEIFKGAVDIGLIDDLSALLSDEFNELCDNAKQIFL